MLKKVLGLFLLLSVLGINLASCSKDQMPATDEELCRTVFDALQKNNVELFTSLLITNEAFQGMVNSLDESDSKEKSIKDEFRKDFNVQEFSGESLKSFKELTTLGQKNYMDLKSATFSGVNFRQLRYEAGNHKCKKLKFKISIGEDFYSVIIYLFQTDEGMFIYDSLQVNEFPNFKFKLVTPSENPVTIPAGQDLDMVIEFDEDAVNKRGAWIETVFNGKSAGMYGGTTIESPYNTDIPGKILISGNHTVEFRIQPSGSNTDNPLETIKLGIIVK